MTLPVSGKALFVRSWDCIQHEGSNDFANRYTAAGFTWAVVCTLWSEKNDETGVTSHRATNRSAAYFDALHARRVSTWACWILPKPGSWREQLGPWLDHGRTVGCVGVVADPEVEWKGAGNRNEARAFAAALRAGCTARGLLLAVTSYSTPQGHQTFPWDVFAGVADLGIAQTYDRDMAFLPAYFARAVSGWRAVGFREVICAGSVWDHRDQRPKTVAELERHLPQVPKLGAALLWPPRRLSLDVLALLPRWSVVLRSAVGGGGGILLLVGVLWLMNHH